MSAAKVSSTEKLLRASSSDETTMAFPIPDVSFGFHGQQAIEKLLKVLLVARTGTHPFSHDLLSLRKRVEKTGLTLPVCAFSFERLLEYAGDGRYDEPIPLTDEERRLVLDCIRVMREFVLRELGG